MNFRRAAETYIATAEVTESTRLRYRALLPHLGQLARRNVERVVARDVAHFIRGLRASGFSPATCRLGLGFVRAVLRAQGLGGAARDVRAPASPRVARAMGTAEQARLLAALPADRHGDALRLLLGTGLRSGELLGLAPADWDAGRRTLRVRASKTGAGVRDVDVPTHLCPLLDRAAREAAGRRGAPLLLGPNEKRQLSRVLQRVCAAAGIAPYRIHDLRHTRITNLLLQGAPLLYVSQQAGHASPGITLTTYGHLTVATQEQRRAWADSVDLDDHPASAGDVVAVGEEEGQAGDS